jgi:chromosome segregation ATPase
VEFPGDGDVMNVSLTTDTAKGSALLVAAVSKAYLDEVVNQEQRLAALQETLNAHQDVFDNKRATLQTLARRLGTIDDQTLSHRQQMIQEQLAAIRKRLISIQFEIAENNVALKSKKAELDSAKTDLSTLMSELELEQAVASDLITANLKTQAKSIREQMANSNSDAERKQLSQQLKNIEQQSANRRREIEKELQRKALADLSAQVDQLESEMAALRELEQQFSKDEARLVSEIKEFGGSLHEVERLQRDIDALDRVIDGMSPEVNALRVQPKTRVAGDDSSDLTVDAIATAIRPRSPDPSPRWFKTIVAAIIGFWAIPLVLFVVRFRRGNG